MCDRRKCRRALTYYRLAPLFRAGSETGTGIPALPGSVPNHTVTFFLSFTIAVCHRANTDKNMHNYVQIYAQKSLVGQDLSVPARGRVYKFSGRGGRAVCTVNIKKT